MCQWERGLGMESEKARSKQKRTANRREDQPGSWRIANSHSTCNVRRSVVSACVCIYIRSTLSFFHELSTYTYLQQPIQQPSLYRHVRWKTQRFPIIAWRWQRHGQTGTLRRARRRQQDFDSFFWTLGYQQCSRWHSMFTRFPASISPSTANHRTHLSPDLAFRLNVHPVYKHLSCNLLVTRWAFVIHGHILFIHGCFRARSSAANLIHRAITLPAFRMTDKSVSIVYHVAIRHHHSFNILDSAMEYIWWLQ